MAFNIDIGDHVVITAKDPERIYEGVLVSTSNGWCTVKDHGSKFDVAYEDIVSIKKQPTKEAVHHPSHYQSESGLEVFDVIEAFTADLKGVDAFDMGNVIKYVCRWKHKNGLEDLKKAIVYLERVINRSEKENE